MKKSISLYAKYIWLSAIVVFISLFIYRRFFLITETFALIPTLNIALSLITLFFAKFLLVVFMYYSLITINKGLSLKVCYHIYHTSQIAKYIPGSIWHFLSRYFAYKQKGFSFTEIKNALIIENLFLVASAFLFGTVILIFKNSTFLNQLFLNYYIWFMSAGAVFFICALVVYFTGNTKVTDWLRKININGLIKVIFALCCIWITLGYSFYILVEPFFKESVTILEITGLFTLAFGLGYITPFAPAGIGIRESVLVFGLSSLINSDIAVIITIFSRILYLLVEILLVLSTLVIRERCLQTFHGD